MCINRTAAPASARKVLALDEQARCERQFGPNFALARPGYRYYLNGHERVVQSEYSVDCGPNNSMTALEKHVRLELVARGVVAVLLWRWALKLVAGSAAAAFAGGKQLRGA